MAQPPDPPAGDAAASPVEVAIALAADDDVAGLRAALRGLLAADVPPAAVRWQVTAGGAADLFAAAEPAATPAAPAAPRLGPAAAGLPTVAPGSAAAPRLPAWFVEHLDHAALHAAPGRHALLHRLAWRLLHEPGLRHDPLDADRQRVEQMARAVRREIHKLHAFVRFRPVPMAEAPGGVAHVAWFEPEHAVLRAAAPFFARRFAQLRWALLTPGGSVSWDGRELRFGAGALRADAPAADAGEGLWLTYYAHIFNPARLNLATMTREMPRRYWNNLPEAALVQPLAASASRRTETMVGQPATVPRRRRPALPAPRGGAADEPERADDADARGPLAAPHKTAPSLAALRLATERCRACPIGEHATQAVNGEGPVGARLMLVGEQPGDQEDLRGRPFVGPAGKLLDRALAQLGWPRDKLYVTNAVKHFKYELRGKRRIHKTPAQQEAAICLDWLETEIALVVPQAIVALGATAARSLLGRPVAVMSERGHWLQRDDGRRVLVTLHPSALLRLDRAGFDAAFDAWVDDLRHAAGVLDAGA